MRWYLWLAVAFAAASITFHVLWALLCRPTRDVRAEEDATVYRLPPRAGVNGDEARIIVFDFIKGEVRRLP